MRKIVCPVVLNPFDVLILSVSWSHLSVSIPVNVVPPPITRAFAGTNTKWKIVDHDKQLVCLNLLASWPSLHSSFVLHNHELPISFTWLWMIKWNAAIINEKYPSAESTKYATNHGQCWIPNTANATPHNCPPTLKIPNANNAVYMDLKPFFLTTFIANKRYKVYNPKYILAATPELVDSNPILILYIYYN